eukprot:CAMPEP_0182456310 /NCGR_PEP_ID=MMETSP1319-20130603/2178_1 /TAXON_ID=172717 /ORGANISM="Bolidomonas pacifica, Strain RCC208" /LENGTH=51 /DNA_ID=CAMNT_0024654523 /DNA_START=551 /DNA_END=706 /DNA_ORIENTATION=-
MIALPPPGSGSGVPAKKKVHPASQNFENGLGLGVCSRMNSTNSPFAKVGLV